MYISNSLLEGLKILSFDKEAIKAVSRERSLEEIFLSTIFLNYLLVLIIYLIGIATGGFSISGRDLNMPVVFGMLLIYPFAYNLLIYFMYGFFGIMAEIMGSKKRVKPLLSVGFHTALVYSLTIFVVALISLKLGLGYGIFVMSIFAAWFIYTMFVSISTLYNFSLPQTLIVIFIPFLIVSVCLLLVAIFAPEVVSKLTVSIFA